MGSNDLESDEKPVHRVTVSDFSMSKTEVTVKQYLAFCDDTGRSYPEISDIQSKLKHPVTDVNWHDAVAFTKWLSQKINREVRLPTEAEWEYAARGGNKSQGYTYAGSDNIDDVAWHGGNSDNKTHPVGTKRPNELGLYDMTGNVWEWCLDWSSSNYNSNSPSNNPQGPSSGEYRVYRGGGWIGGASGGRVAFRGGDTPDSGRNDYGFRVVFR